MSKWIRGIYNAAANFNMSGSLRAASGRTLGRDAKHLSEESNESDKYVESCESSKSDQSGQHACSCHATRTCNCSAGSCADNDDGSRPLKRNCVIADFNVLDPSAECTCPLCREYYEYATSASIRTEGQGAGARIRVSNEPRNFKQSNSDATDTIEQSTGIPTGVTV